MAVASQPEAKAPPVSGSLLSRKPDARRSGQATALILAPHLVLGTWLLVVPDHRAFLSSQVVTLLHTALALLTLPAVGFWMFWHAWRMAGPKARNTRSALAVRWSLIAAVTFAVVTGFIVIWGGDITPAGRLHALCGVVVGVPLAFHLWLGAHRGWATGVALLLLASSGGAVLARLYLPPEPLEATVPEFSYRTRQTDLYEPSSWCGECHEDDYADWRRSSHAQTLNKSHVQSSLTRFDKALGFDLHSVGRIIDGDRSMKNSDQAIFSCEACHAPAGFYGQSAGDLRQAKGVITEGINCAFCHTLRGVRVNEVKEARTEIRLQGTADYYKFLPQMPAYVSAPETVRRYLGQGSRNPVLRAIGNYLIRWRPTVHSHDYHSPVLDSSAGCLACHSSGGLDEGPDIPHKTYISWKQSHFNTGDRETTVTCQDCHMAREMTGKPVREWARMVPWGPLRQPGRSHLLLGGNVNAARMLGDEDYARMEHEFSTRAAKIRLVDVKVEARRLLVTGEVEALLVGHYLPAMETHNRYLYVQARIYGADGKELASSAPPKNVEDFEAPSALLSRCTGEPKPECDTLLRPGSSRRYTARLDLPEGVNTAQVSTIAVELRLSIDLEAVARDASKWELPRAADVAPARP